MTAGKVRIGFIGSGGIAERHVGVLRTFEDVDLAAFADPDIARASRLAQASGARAYETHREMLAAETLDAVYICVPPFAHGEPENAAIDAGLPFFVEKPLALDLETAVRIARRVESRKIVSAVGYHWRYLDTVEEARGILAGNPARLITGYWLGQTPPPRWWWRQDSSGGQIVEQATHIVDLARHLVGEIVEVYAQAGHASRADFPDLDVAASTAVTLRFADGAVGNLSATCMLRWGHRIGLNLFGDGLAIELTDREIMVDVGRGRPVRAAQGDPVWREDRDFVDAVLGRENRLRCSYAEALKTHRAALAIARSAATGRPVRIANMTLEAADA